MMPGDVGIRDDGTLGPADAVRDQGAAARQQTLADQHVVGAVTQGNANAGRRIPPA